MAESKKAMFFTIESEITYDEFAKIHGTDTKKLNELNGLDLPGDTLLAKDSQLWAPPAPEKQVAPAPEPAVSAPVQPAPTPPPAPASEPTVSAPAQPAPTPLPAPALVASAPVQPAPTPPPVPAPVATAPAQPTPTPAPVATAPAQPTPTPAPVATAPAQPAPVEKAEQEPISQLDFSELKKKAKDGTIIVGAGSGTNNAKDVKLIQDALINSGLMEEVPEADKGKAGPKTHAGIKELQTLVGLKDDGKVSRLTLAAAEAFHDAGGKDAGEKAVEAAKLAIKGEVDELIKDKAYAKNTAIKSINPDKLPDIAEKLTTSMAKS